MRRTLLIALIAYTLLDFANPLVPGAVNFNDDETILGARRAESGAPEGMPLAAGAERRAQVPGLDTVQARERPAVVVPPARPRRSPPPRHATVSRSPDGPDGPDGH